MTSSLPRMAERKPSSANLLKTNTKSHPLDELVWETWLRLAWVPDSHLVAVIKAKSTAAIADPEPYLQFVLHDFYSSPIAFSNSAWFSEILDAPTDSAPRLPV